MAVSIADDIRQMHQKDGNRCGFELSQWPCEAIRLADSHDRLESALFDARFAHDKAEAAWAAEHERVRKLADSHDELLRAAEGAVGRIWHDGTCRTSDASGPCDCGGWGIQEQIDAAIAKAKGETQ